MKDVHQIKTLGQLKASDYQPRSIKAELRENLIQQLKEGKNTLDGIIGYEDTVIPMLQTAILAGHSINLLGLRGQAKTRIARSMVQLLDEYIPVVEGAELNDDPMAPISVFGKATVKEKGDETPVLWLHRSERYAEKLATPDVSVSDLVGDVDPIKAASLKLSYADERVIHYGIIPRSNRCIFVINELPDLQPRIQVALFNMLQEEDIQIRGFKMRWPLDIQFVFTANPEDYTQRGSIITPLKDRIQSQILTHYPRNIEVAKSITQQEAKISEDRKKRIEIPNLIEDLLEQIAFEARESELIDQKSGVSARLTITGKENLVSTAERRMLLNGEKTTTIRIGDFSGVIPAIIGKIELVYEGEQEGAVGVAHNLLGKAIRHMFPLFFPDPELVKKKKVENPYENIINWFASNELELSNEADKKTYETQLLAVDGLQELIKKYSPGSEKEHLSLMMEFALHGLAEYSLLSKSILDQGLAFSDLLNAVFSMDDEDDYEGSY